jgi:DNA-binding protein YbaB
LFAFPFKCVAGRILCQFLQRENTMNTMKVTAYPKASVLQDGSLVEIELQGADKERVTLQFDPEALDRFLARATRLIADARNKKHAKSGHPGSPALAAVAAGAAPAVGGSHVVVFLQTNTGTEYNFGLPTDGAEQLAQYVASAVADARKQAAQTRQ